ncbi:hypothetical protein CHS0354_041920 [Potamilus streckersoni]|uniref:BHLH domain-containing protein n=1 Tax=Potamilus streckersoni TaxID=2493646 RepID=A0AAE0SSU4_9BIVA|nr:hypothetical protein CHS0354_041920 [Potamilus streckersoni]
MARTKKNVLDSISKAKKKHYNYFRLKSNGTFHHKHTARKSLPSAEYYEVREQLADVREVIRNSAIFKDQEKGPEVVCSAFLSDSSTYVTSSSQAEFSSQLANVQKSLSVEKELVVEINSDSEEEEALDSDTKEENRTTFKVGAELEAYIKKNWKKPVIFLSDVLDDPVYKMSYSPKGLRSSSRNISPKVPNLAESTSPRSLRAKKSSKIEKEAGKTSQSENELKGVESKQEHPSKQGSKLSSSIGLESSKKLVSIIKNLKPSEMTCKRTSSHEKGSPLQERGKSSPNPLQVPDKPKVSNSPKLGALKLSPSSNTKEKLSPRNRSSHMTCSNESPKQVPKITISGAGDYPSLTKFNENDQFRTPFSLYPECSSEDETPQLRAQRRIRSPNARYTDNMILFPWDSPRKRDSPRKVLPKPKSPNKSPNSSSASDSYTDERGPEMKKKSSSTENELNNSCISTSEVSHAVRNLTFEPNSRKEILMASANEDDGDNKSADENIPKSKCSLKEHAPSSSMEIKDSETSCCNLGLNKLIAKVSGNIETLNTVTSMFEVLTPLFGAGLACDSDSESDEETNSDSASDEGRGIQRNDKCGDVLGDGFMPDSQQELSGIQRSVNIIDEVQGGDNAKETEGKPRNAAKLDKRKAAETFSSNEEQMSTDDIAQWTGESNDLSLTNTIANKISSQDGELDGQVESFSLTEVDLDLKESEFESKKPRNIFDLFEMSGSEEKHDSKGVSEVSEKDQLQIHSSPIKSSDKSPTKGEKSSEGTHERASKDNSISDNKNPVDSNSDRGSEKNTPSKESDRSSTSAVFRRPVPRKSTKRETVQPLPMTVLKNVELPDSTKMSAFVSDKLEKYLSAVRGKPLASVKKEPNEPPTLEVNEPGNDKERSEGGSENKVFNPRFEKEIMESEPDFDEVNGLLFISFPTKNALDAHLEVERKVQWATSEQTMLGVSRINRLKEKAKSLGSSAKITELKMEGDIEGNLRGMHKCAEKYKRIFSRELELILEAKEKTNTHQVMIRSPTKTSDITKIKGWKNKFSNVEELQSATGLSFTESGKLHWKTEEKLVKKLDPSNAKKIGLDLKKKRRKYFAFTKRKGMSRGDPKAKASHGVGFEGSGDDSLSSSVSSVVAQENMSQENDQEKLPYSVRFFAQHKYDRRKKFVKIMKLSTEEEFILKKLGSQTIAQRTARRERETSDEPELQRDLLLFPRLTQSMALAAVSALDNVFPVSARARRKETKTKGHPVKRKLEEERVVKGDCMNISGGTEDIEESTDAYSEQEAADGETYEYKLIEVRKDQPTSASSKSCGKPGCRYGCICHLCKFNESPDESSQSESPSYPEKNSMVCDKEYCRLGCICDSLEGKVESQKNNHCKKAKCMLEYRCRPDSVPARNDQSQQNSLGLRQKHTNRQSDKKASKEGKAVSENKDIPTLTSGDKDSTTKQDEEKNKDAGKAKNRFSTLPKRESTYRLAKNLDAISRKAWQVYESSEIYVDQRVKRRKSDPIEIPKKESAKTAQPSDSQTQIKLEDGTNQHPEQNIKSENTRDQTELELNPTTGEFEISDDDEPFSNFGDELLCSRTMLYVPKRYRQTGPVKLSTSAVKPIPSSTKPCLASSTVPQSMPTAAVTDKGKSAAEKLGLTTSYAAMTASEKIGLKSKLPTPPPALSQSKWRTQMVCLKAKKKVGNPGEKVQSEIKLLEIISDCKWEEERTNILSKISQIISKQEEITPQSTTYGDYKLEFLPKADKPASIPPELKSKLPESMYSIRIRVTKDTDEVEIVGISLEIETRKQDLGTEPAKDSQNENSATERQQRLIQKIKFAERLKAFLKKEEKDGITRQGSFISKESIDKALNKYRTQLHSLTSTNTAVPIITSSSVSVAPSSLSSSGISGFKSMNIIHTQGSSEAQPVDKDKTPTVSSDQTMRYCITGNTLRPSGNSILPGVSIAQVITSGQAAKPVQSAIQAQMKLPNGGQSEVYLIPVTGSTTVPTQLVQLVPNNVMTAVGNIAPVVGTSHVESIFTTSQGVVTSNSTVAKSQAQATQATQIKRKKALSSQASTESVTLTTSTSTIASLGMMTASKSSQPANVVRTHVDPDSVDWIGSPKVAWIKPTNTDIAQASIGQTLSGTSFIAVAGKPLDGYGEPRVLSSAVSSDLTAKSSTSASTECKTTSTVSQATATRTVMLSPGQQVAGLTGGPLVTLASSSGGFTPLRLLQTQVAGPNQKFLQLLPVSGTVGKGTGSGVHPGYIAVPFTLKPSGQLVTAVKPNASSSLDTNSAVTLNSTEYGSHQIPLKTTSGTVMQSFVAVPQNLKGTSFVPVQSLPTSTVPMGKTQAHLVFAKLQPANGPPLLPKCSEKTKKDMATKEGDDQEKEKPKKKKKKKKKKSEKEGASPPGDKETKKKKKKKKKKVKKNGDDAASSDIKEVESMPAKSGGKSALNPLSQSAPNIPSISSGGIVVTVKYAPLKSQTVADMGKKESDDVDTLSSSQKSLSSLESSCNVSDLISHTDDAGKQIAHALGTLDGSSSSSEMDPLKSVDSKLLSDKEKHFVNSFSEEMKEQMELKSYTEMESNSEDFVPSYFKSSSGIKDHNDVVKSDSLQDSEVRVVNGSYTIETEQQKEGGRNCILVYEDVLGKQSCISKNTAFSANCLNANMAISSDCTLNSNIIQNQEPETGTLKTMPLKRTKDSLLPDDASAVPSKRSRCNSPSLSLADSQFSYGSLSDHSEDPASLSHTQLSLARYLNGDDVISIESSDLESEVDIETVDGHEPTSLLITTQTEGELTVASSEYMMTATEQMMNLSKKKRKSQLQPLENIVFDDLEFKEEVVLVKSDNQYKREEKDRQIHRHREKSRRSEMKTCFSELRDILIQDKSLYPCGVPKQLVLSQALHTIKEQEKKAELLETSYETEKAKQANLKEQLKAITDSFAKNGVPALILKNFLKSVEKCSVASTQSTSPQKPEVIVIPSSNYIQPVTSKGTFLNLGSLASVQTHVDLSGKTSCSQKKAKSLSEIKLGQKSKVIRPQQLKKTSAPEIYIDNPELNSSVVNINLLDMAPPKVNVSHSSVEDHTNVGDTERCTTQSSKMFVLASGFWDDARLQRMTLLQEPTKSQTQNSALSSMNVESRDSDDEVRSSTGDLPCETDFPVSQEDLQIESMNVNNGETFMEKKSEYVIVEEIGTGETKEVISLES